MRIVLYLDSSISSDNNNLECSCTTSVSSWSRRVSSNQIVHKPQLEFLCSLTSLHEDSTILPLRFLRRLFTYDGFCCAVYPGILLFSSVIRRSISALEMRPSLKSS